MQGCVCVRGGVAKITLLTCDLFCDELPICDMCSYIHCVIYAVELEGVSELQQAMSQQQKELLEKMKLLKCELAGELYICVY